MPVKAQLWHQVIDNLRLLPSNPGGSKSTTLEDDSPTLNTIFAEKAYLDTALENLNILLALTHETSNSTSNPHSHFHPNEALSLPRATTPISASAALLGGGNNKRKRGLEISPSPIPTLSPSREVNSPLLARGGTPLSAMGFNKIKKERDGGREYTGPYADQLPLQPGRKVAFRTLEGDLWILCDVKRCLGDKTKYEVQDSDDDKS
jgi:SAGA-associated factor 29